MMTILIPLLLVVSNAFAAGPTATTGDGVQLTQVSVEEKAGKTLLHFELNKAAELTSVEARFLRRTVEWDIKNVGIKKDKMFVNVSSNDINNVYVSYLDATSIRVRVNLDNNKIASNYHERMSFHQEGSKITMVMDPASALISSNIRELNRIYDVSASHTQKITDHMNTASILKVGTVAAPNTLTAAAKAEQDEDNTIVLDDKKSEAEIPLKLKNKETKSAAGPSMWRMFLGLAAAGLLLISVVIIGRKVNAKRLGAQFSKESITVISQKYLGPKRNLTLVRVAGEYLLLGVTDHNISLIKSLSVVDDEIPDLTPNDFGAAVKTMTAKADGFDEQMNDIEDSFSVSSLNDVKKMFRKRKYIDE